MPGRNTRVVLMLSLIVVAVGFLGWYFVLRPNPDADLGGASPVRNADATIDAEPPPARAAAPGALTGKVLVFGTNEPGAGIPIRITGGAKPVTLVTGKDGSFVARVASEVPLTLVVESPDPWSPVTMPGLQVEPEGTEALGTIYLTVGFVVRGRVTDGRGGAVAGAKVRAYRHTSSEMEPSFLSILTAMSRPREALDESVSGPDGTFELTKLHPGTIRIEAEAEGFAIGAVDRALVSPETEDRVFTIVLSPGVKLSGTVKNAADEAIAGATVTALRLSRAFQQGLEFAPVQRQTDEKGVYEFTALAPGQVGLMVTAEGYPTRMVNQVDLNGPQTVDVVLGGTAIVEGKVTGPEDEPVAGARVVLAAGQRDGAFGRTTTDEEGRYRIENLPEGQIQFFSVEADGYAPYPAGGGPFGGRRPGGEGELKSDETLTKDVKLETGATVDGYVTDTATGRPVAGARVRLFGASMFRGGGGKGAVTDDEGHYEIAGVAEGRHLLAVQAPGYFQPGMAGSGMQSLFRPGRAEDESADAPVVTIGPEDTTKRKDLKVSPGATVSGVVVGPDGRPVTGAEVSTADPAGRMNPFAQLLDIGADPVMTDGEGKFTMEGVAAADALRLTARAEGYVDGEADPIAVAAGGEVTGVTIRLGEGATITGLLRSEDGSTPTAAEIRLVPETDNLQDWQLGWQVRQADPHPADETGAFRAEGIAPGRYIVVAQAGGHMDKLRRGVQLSEGAEVDLGTISLEKGLAIEGVVSDEAGNPVPNAYVTCSPHRNPGARPTPALSRPEGDRTDVEGKFRIEKLTPGVYDLGARADGFAEATLDTVDAGATRVRITLSPGLSIEGRVLFPSGKPAANVSVTAQAEGGRGRGGRTDGEGHFEITELPDGIYRLTVSGNGFRFGPGGAQTDRESFRDTTLEGISAGTRDLLIRLDAGLSIGGVVVDEQGSPVANGFVFATGPDNSRSFARTDEQGRFELSGLAPGKFRLQANVPGQNQTPRMGTLSDVAAGSTGVRLVVKEPTPAPERPDGPR